MDKHSSSLKIITFTSWSENSQLLTFDVTKDGNTERYHLGLNSLLDPDTTPFQIK